jgi:hypothetical protein
VSNLWVEPEELGDLATSEYAYEACKTASYLLWGMSGRKFSGTNTVTESYDYVGPSVQPRDFYNGFPDQIARNNSFGGSDLPRSIRLRGTPVHSIESVTNANGEEYSGDDFRLVDRQYIEFKSTPPSVLTVTYTYGAMPPMAGRMAARKLAREFARLWEGSDECDLPSRVTSISRDGVSYTVLDNQDFIDELRTGVYEVDLFLKTVNPDHARKRSRVLHAGQRRGRRSNGFSGAGGYGTGGYGQ